MGVGADALDAGEVLHPHILVPANMMAGQVGVALCVPQAVVMAARSANRSPTPAPPRAVQTPRRAVAGRRLGDEKGRLVEKRGGMANPPPLNGPPQRLSSPT